MDIERLRALREFIVNNDDNSTAELFRVEKNEYFNPIGPVTRETLRSNGWVLAAEFPLQDAQKKYAGQYCVFTRQLK
jgi:hypothetical protein